MRHTLAPGAARAQGNQGQHLYPVAGVVADAPALPNGGEDHFDFHPGESIADALAGAAAERKVGVAGQPGAELGASSGRAGIRRGASNQRASR